MSEIIHQLSTMSYEDAKDVAAYAVMAAGAVVPAGLVFYTMPRSNRSDEQGVRGVDVEEVATIVNEDKWGRRASHLRHWLSVSIAGLSGSVMSVQMLEPYNEEQVAVPDAAVVQVVDASVSMQLTEDMAGLSRYEAARNSVVASAPNLPADASTAVLLAGGEVVPVVPLTTDKAGLADAMSIDVSGQPSTDTDSVQEQLNNAPNNKGNLTQALRDASTLLESSGADGPKALVVYSDGSIDNPQTAAAEINEIAENGTQVFVNVIGTPEGAYMRDFDLEPTPSAVQPEAFAAIEGLDNVTVLHMQQPSALSAEISDFMRSETTAMEKRPSQLFYKFGIIGLFAATLVNAMQRLGDRGRFIRRSNTRIGA